jgi:hypothetical protein
MKRKSMGNVYWLVRESLSVSKSYYEFSPRRKTKQHFSITKITWLKQFREITDIYCDNRTKPLNTVRGKNARIVNVKADDSLCKWKSLLLWRFNWPVSKTGMQSFLNTAPGAKYKVWCARCRWRVMFRFRTFCYLLPRCPLDTFWASGQTVGVVAERNITVCELFMDRLRKKGWGREHQIQQTYNVALWS